MQLKTNLNDFHFEIFSGPSINYERDTDRKNYDLFTINY